MNPNLERPVKRRVHTPLSTAYATPPAPRMYDPISGTTASFKFMIVCLGPIVGSRVAQRFRAYDVLDCSLLPTTLVVGHQSGST